MSLDQDIRKALEPFAMRVEETCDMIRRCSDRELAIIATSHNAVSETNCSWSLYKAAHLVHDLAGHELLRRQQKAVTRPHEETGMNRGSDGWLGR